MSTLAILGLITIDKFRRYYESINQKQWIAPTIAFISEQADASEIQADANVRAVRNGAYQCAKH
jgi:hypothetical protein